MSTNKDYVRILFRQKGIVLLTISSLLVAVYVGLELKTPLYEAQVTMLIQARKHIESPYYRDISQSDTVALTATQSEIVKSNPVMERVVRRLHLDAIPKDYEKPFASPLKSLLIDIRAKLRSVSRDRQSPIGRSEIQFRKAVDNLKRRVSVASVRDTNLFSVSVRDYSPEMAAQIANMISRSYSIFDLEQQLAEMKQKYGEKHLFVKQLKDNIRDLESMTPGSIIASIDAIGPASVKVIEQAVPPIKPKGVPRVLILLVSIVVSCVAGMVCAYAVDGWDSSFRSPQEVREQVALPFLGYIPRIPSVIGFPVHLARLTIRFVLVLLAFLLLLDWISRWAGVDPRNPLIEAHTFVISRLSAFCVFFLPPALDAYARQYPFFSLVLLAAAGFLTSAFLSVWLRRLDRKHPLIEYGRTPGFVIRAYQDVIEEFVRIAQSKRVRSVVFCASHAGSDESILVANCAKLLAQHKRLRVLVIDANLHAQPLAGLLRTSTDFGLVEVLSEEKPWKQAVREVSFGFSLLPSGKQRERMLSSYTDDLMQRVIKEAEKEYDLVLVVSAAITEYQELRILSRQTDGVVLTVREGATNRGTFKAQVEVLESKGVRFLGVILSNRRFVIPRIIYDRT